MGFYNTNGFYRNPGSSSSDSNYNSSGPWLDISNIGTSYTRYDYFGYCKGDDSYGGSWIYYIKKSSSGKTVYMYCTTTGGINPLNPFSKSVTYEFLGIS